MKIILATSNKHKVLELKEILKDFEIYAFDEVLMPFCKGYFKKNM